MEVAARSADAMNFVGAAVAARSFVWEDEVEAETIFVVSDFHCEREFRESANLQFQMPAANQN